MGSNPGAPETASFSLRGVGRIPLRNRHGKVRAYATVDLADFRDVNQHRWHLNSRGYACRQLRVRPGYDGQASLAMHRYVLGLGPGDAPGMHVDHINGEQLDNRRLNLRLVTVAENQQNRRRARSDSTSGLRGVRREGSRWAARAQINGERRYLGSFDVAEDAAAAVEAFWTGVTS